MVVGGSGMGKTTFLGIAIAGNTHLSYDLLLNNEIRYYDHRTRKSTPKAQTTT
jgi:ABC-type lipoprotein export system ATPase subunit